MNYSKLNEVWTNIFFPTGLLASGGGFADETIRFWNTITGQAKSIRSITTDSQVCNLAWSPHSAEFVSTHGYSTHLIKVWKYPSLEKIGELDNGRYDRAMYLSMSPRGENIVTGGYETLRFWNVFKKRKDKRRSELDLYKIRWTREGLWWIFIGDAMWLFFDKRLSDRC